MRAHNTWENFPCMLYMVRYANYHNSGLRKHDSVYCKCPYNICTLFLYVMGTILNRFPLFSKNLLIILFFDKSPLSFGVTKPRYSLLDCFSLG